MLEYFREVEATGEPLIVTDRGREVLEIRPVETAAGRSHSDMILRETHEDARIVNSQRSQEELLEELRILATPRSPISEEELMAPLPLTDWEVEREDDHNPWS